MKDFTEADLQAIEADVSGPYADDVSGDDVRELVARVRGLQTGIRAIISARAGGYYDEILRELYDLLSGGGAS